MSRIQVLDGRTLNKGDLSWDGLQALGECHIYENTQEDDVTERCQGAEIVLTNKVRILKGNRGASCIEIYWRFGNRLQCS